MYIIIIFVVVVIMIIIIISVTAGLMASRSSLILFLRRREHKPLVPNIKEAFRATREAWDTYRYRVLPVPLSVAIHTKLRKLMFKFCTYICIVHATHLNIESANYWRLTQSPKFAIV